MTAADAPQFLDRAGMRLAYTVDGDGDPPIIFIHGWSCDRSYLGPQIQHFGRRHAVAALDLRGHGDSDRPEPGLAAYDVSAFADDVLALAADLGFDRPVVVGHSLGGLVALECATRSRMVSAVVMIDVAPIANHAIKALLRESVPIVRDDLNGTWRTNFVETMFLPSDTTRQGGIIKAMTTVPPLIAAACLQAIADFDGIAALRAVTVPVLSIGAAAPHNAASDLLAACPTITIGQTVGAGHFNQLEVPDQVNAMMARFLAVNELLPA